MEIGLHRFATSNHIRYSKNLFQSYLHKLRSFHSTMTTQIYQMKQSKIKKNHRKTIETLYEWQIQNVIWMIYHQYICRNKNNINLSKFHCFPSTFFWFTFMPNVQTFYSWLLISTCYSVFFSLSNWFCLNLSLK